MIRITGPNLKPINLFIPTTSTKSGETRIYNCHQNFKLSLPKIKFSVNPRVHILNPLINPNRRWKPFFKRSQKKNGNVYVERIPFYGLSNKYILITCWFSYWVQGFRCFPWLAMNFHMANGLHFHPSALQLIQQAGNLPMVAKPLYGIFSDAVYIGGANRLPYICIGALLQLLSWGSLALIPLVGEGFYTLMICILISNLGASIAEVASDALTTELSRNNKNGELQSLAFMALSTGALMGNLCGGYFLLKYQNPKVLFFAFSTVLFAQLAISFTTNERSVNQKRSPSVYCHQNTLTENLQNHFSDLTKVINQENIFRPLLWIVASIMVVPILSGTLFCFQTQSLNLDSSIIGSSKVIGQVMVLTAIMFYNKYLKKMPMRNLIFVVQLVYAISILSDLFLVKQINLKFGISNEAYVLCLSALAEAIAQFKILPFTVLFANLCPKGYEGSLIAFLASSLCLSSILSGFFGVGLASLVGISSQDFSGLPNAILVQFFAALLPLLWISYLPLELEKIKGGRSR